MFAVAGVSGRTGAATAEALLKQGQKVRVLVRDEAQGEPWLRRHAEVAVLDLTDSEALAAALKGLSGAYLLLPTNPSGASQYPPRNPNPGVRLYQPAPAEGSPETPIPSPMPKGPVMPPPATELFPPPPSNTNPAFSSGIADFAEVKEGISAGLKPNLPGLEWLKAKGYKTVLRLRKPTEEDTDQATVERQGLKYLSIAVSPETLNQDLIDSFNKIVGDATNQSLFVYDRDGSLAGSMWYLYFRTSESLKDDEALLRARKYGLRENASADQTALWLAVQKYLASKS